MENRQDLRSILPFLPLKLESSRLVWPNQAIEALKSLSRGPSQSRVDSGEVLFLAISDIRNSLSLFPKELEPSVGDGYALFFDELLSRAEAAKWFGEVVPVMANLLLRLPELLESHYENADYLLSGVETGLRLLEPQKPGIVFLSQELIGALLSCSFFCLFPSANRGAKHLPAVNFDQLFTSIYESYHEKYENKIKCIIHYFERICSCIPMDFVSFERKVLPLEHNLPHISYPNADFWAKSTIHLCQFQICTSGLIEDQSRGALEVDFSNKYLGGGALHRGCVQEEIRFMINPELIVGMLFLPSMSDNEAIEIVGAERFSDYTGYASSFRFSGDLVDRREKDAMGRRNTRIIAIDALCNPGVRQYRLDFLLREVNKAFCGFLDQSKYQNYPTFLQDYEFSFARLESNAQDSITDLTDHPLLSAEESTMSMDTDGGQSSEQLIKHENQTDNKLQKHQSSIGVATGNWGCGAFGGDPEVKTVIQWLAASQAMRPFILYYTFGMEELRNLDKACEWILSQKWTVGDLWNMLVDYSSKRARGDTKLGFFSWLLPSLYTHDEHSYIT